MIVHLSPRRLTLATVALALISGAVFGPSALCLDESSPAHIPPTTHAASHNPLLTLTRHAPKRASGLVRERHRAGSYTYMLVEHDARATWAVVLGEGAAPGRHVQLTIWAEHPAFDSARLRRTFSPLRFASVR